jgi:Ca-activated chloride channel homolog
MTQPLPILSRSESDRPANAEAGFGALHTPGGALPLEAMDVHGRIDGLLAHVAIAQTFVNTRSEPVEATYIFPLPDRAAVTDFRMEVNGRVIDGVLQERAAARKAYDEAIEAGQRAAIAEEERPEVFTMRVGNLMPGERATVRLSSVGPLSYSDGEATFRFPLVVAPRYIPGTPLPGPPVGSGTALDTDAVPDASRITPPVLLPGFPSPVRLSLRVDLSAAGLPLADIQSSLHAIAAQEVAGKWRITVQPGERLDRDFILRFRLADSKVHSTLLLKPDPDSASQEGTYVLTVVPPAGAAGAQKPRDVALVLDRSGSMAGWKMVAARRALARMVDTLTDHDRFAVLAFDDSIETPPSLGAGLVPAHDRNRFRAVEFLARIESRGGTEMAQPLDGAAALLQESEAGRERILVLVTDGQVGNEDQILRHLAPRLQGVRVFTLGIDQAVNGAFLRRLAVLGGGACELVESEDRLDAVMDRVHRRIGAPALTDLRLKAAGLRLDGDAQVPARIPDLFAGAPLLLTGRYRGAAQGSIALEGRDAAGRPWAETATAQSSSNPSLTATWARGFLRVLEDRYVVATSDRQTLEKRIVETSLRFSVLCRFTAFVAVDRSTAVNPGGKLHQIVQPVEAPAGWEMLTSRGSSTTKSGFACAKPMPMACAVPSVASAPMKVKGKLPGPKAPRADAKRSVARSFLGGVVNKLSSIMHSCADTTEQEELPPIDLDAYRRRARTLVERLTADSNADRLTQLGTVAEKLDELLEDMRSIGAKAAELAPLETLLASLRTLLASAQPSAMEVDRLWAQTLAGLAAFAGPATAPRSEFWK